MFQVIFRLISNAMHTVPLIIQTQVVVVQFG